MITVRVLRLPRALDVTLLHGRFTYVCSELRAMEIIGAIKEKGLDGGGGLRTLRMQSHRRDERGGLNWRRCSRMANIREHVSWTARTGRPTPTSRPIWCAWPWREARQDRALFSKKFDVNKRVMIIGGGVAGIQAALDRADGGPGGPGREDLVHRRQDGQARRRPSTVDCSSCILGP